MTSSFYSTQITGLELDCITSVTVYNNDNINWCSLIWLNFCLIKSYLISSISFPFKWKKIPWLFDIWVFVYYGTKVQFLICSRSTPNSEGKFRVLRRLRSIVVYFSPRDRGLKSLYMIGWPNYGSMDFRVWRTSKSIGLRVLSYKKVIFFSCITLIQEV